MQPCRKRPSKTSSQGCSTKGKQGLRVNPKASGAKPNESAKEIRTCHAGAMGCHAGATQWMLELPVTVAAVAARVPLAGSEKAHCIPSEKPSPCSRVAWQQSISVGPRKRGAQESRSPKHDSEFMSQQPQAVQCRECLLSSQYPRPHVLARDEAFPWHAAGGHKCAPGEV